ncbi:MAG TPA: glycoside hydrolase family 127 protein, partial [Bacteroidales bacterium]|nr:glycoside hydrolase family 127 protein [Bacteroidales bacterium]
MKKTIMLCALLACTGLYAQDKGLVNTTKSPYARIWNTDVSAVSWTDGFWGERFEVCRDTMVINMWHVMSDPEVSHAFRNLEIAAGEAEGRHSGPPFNDGDFFKWFESAAAVYAVTKDPKLDALMDRIITTIAKAQREDGYMHTQVIIPERKRQREQASQQSGPVGTAVGTAQGGAFSDRLNFETYNHGHLMTAACVHYRATGKRNMLELAIKAADFLCRFYETATAELARNAICPSHYMGVVEMYRTTGDPKYLELSKNLINIRGMVENGTDDNQDRVPFRQQKLAMGHAVRANYLYAG